MDEKYLAHHGILGQKWGHQNGPPYPLNPSKDYSAAEKKKNPSLVEKAKAKLAKSSAQRKRNKSELSEARKQAKEKLRKDIANAKQQAKIDKIKAKYEEKTSKKIDRIHNPKKAADVTNKILNRNPEVIKSLRKDIIANPTPEKILANKSILSTFDVREAKTRMELFNDINKYVKPSKSERVKKFILESTYGVGDRVVKDLGPTAVEAMAIQQISKSDNPTLKAVASAWKEQRKSKNKNKDNNNNNNNNNNNKDKDKGND